MNESTSPSTSEVTFEGLWQEFLDCLQHKYAQFSGRARRREFWGFYLFSAIAGMILGIISQAGGILTSIIVWLVSLVLLIPSIAVQVRRLHDVGKSGWLTLLALIPIVGLILIYWDVQDSQPGTNEYGPNPKGVEPVA